MNTEIKTDLSEFLSFCPRIVLTTVMSVLIQWDPFFTFIYQKIMCHSARPHISVVTLVLRKGRKPT
jgi:hypothetical protein